MGLLDRLFRRDLAEHPAPWLGWDDHDSQRRAAAAKVLFDRVLARLGATGTHGEHQGDPCVVARIGEIRVRATVCRSSARLEVEMKYPERGLRSIDLMGDESATASPDEPWDEHEARHFVDTHTYFEGSSARQERAAFEALPEPLRARVLAAIRDATLRYFRSRDGELDAHSERGVLGGADAVDLIAAVISAAIDVTLARLADAPRAVVAHAPDRPLAGARAREGEARWTYLTEALQPWAVRLGGDASIVVRRGEDAVELRWTAAGVPVRVVANTGWNHLEVQARALHAPIALELTNETEAHLDHAADGDAWGEVDARRVFIAPQVCVEGTAEELRAQISLVAGLPDDVGAELLHAIGAGKPAWLEVDEKRVHTVLCEVDEATAEMLDDAIGLAGLFGRFAAALPERAPGGAVGRELVCRYCGARSFVVADVRCGCCGAPG